MSKPPPRPSTSDRVLDLACALFNEQGTEHVTTKMIAAAAAINEGNLYYHFRTKAALYEALFTRFEAASLDLFPAQPPASMADYAALLRNWFMLSWSYRFLFRDSLALLVAAPALAPRLRALSARLQAQNSAVLTAMQAQGLLIITPEASERLLANLWIVSSYWMNHLVLHQGVQSITPAHLHWGHEQVRSLYEPYLSPLAREQLAQLPQTAFAP
jgi:AcrR family transcriptional regulator